MLKVVSLKLQKGASLTDALNSLSSLDLSPCQGANWNVEIQGIINSGADLSTLSAVTDETNIVSMWQYSTPMS
jgi:hypothetical protein